ncbi:MAG TPA: hypothetical protein VGW14_08085 [Thermoleophilaceae bacterium]|nr:hypothetical protein [Thermoleophilaceae bacterium]
MFRRLLPSPAMVVAVVALIMSLGGSAYALVVTGKQIRNNTVTGKDVRNRSLTGNEMRRDKLGGASIKESSLGPVGTALVAHGGARFAVVNGDGLLVRGRDVSSVARTGDGRYQVIFSGDIRGCAYFATVADPSAAAPPQNSQVSVSSLASNVNGVAVRTENGNNGSEANRPFHLIVMC